MKQPVEVGEELQQQELEEEEELLMAELQRAEDGDRRVKQHTHTHIHTHECTHTQVMIRICHQMPLPATQSQLSTQYC